MAQNSTTASRTSGIGFLGLLTILFIGLKLTGHIDWSWWLVLLPVYGPLTLALSILGIFFVVAWIADR